MLWPCVIFGGLVKFFKMRLITASVLMSIDNSLKNLVDTLEDEGMLSNTVLFVNSDNGGDTLYAKGHPGNNFPMRSLKFSYYEGGVRVPAFVFAPGIVPEARQGSAYHGMMHHVDLVHKRGVNGVNRTVATFWVALQAFLFLELSLSLCLCSCRRFQKVPPI